MDANKHAAPLEILKDGEMSRRQPQQSSQMAWRLFETEFENVPKHKLHWLLPSSFVPLMSECFINLGSKALGHN